MTVGRTRGRSPVPSLARMAGLVGGAALAALTSGGPAAATGLARLTAATSSDLYVAVVIDFGGGSGAPQNISTCVKVPQGSTDADALVAAVGQSNLSYAPSGLLCGIDGYPANAVANCNKSSGNAYYFWSYWNGTGGSWSYASKGPASTLVTPGDVEGWRYQDPGPASSAAPPPGFPPKFSPLCSAEYASAPTAATTTTAGSQPARGAPPNPTTTTTAPRGATVTVPPAGTPRTTTSVATRPKAPDHTAATTTTSGAAGDRASTSTLPSSSGRVGAHALGPQHRAHSSDADWVAPLLVGLLVIGLGVAAAIRWRRRPTGS